MGINKGTPVPPLEDVSMRIYLCEGLLGKSKSSFLINSTILSLIHFLPTFFSPFMSILTALVNNTGVILSAILTFSFSKSLLTEQSIIL